MLVDSFLKQSTKELSPLSTMSASSNVEDQSRLDLIILKAAMTAASDMGKSFLGSGGERVDQAIQAAKIHSSIV